MTTMIVDLLIVAKLLESIIMQKYMIINKSLCNVIKRDYDKESKGVG